ncbi:glutaredoxin domain-containing protein [Cryptosporangium aurantiacum]|uniref:Glutaredoxin n=1 Tax=Cryptosporangium aurantiacum TaxID=134849 RepID=A0A1M7TW12_9ACTN|nr:glutaredoxin domain-containing protein [Cryptosporangium aurantiacum]SHN74906.1 Glutaredoxin [Cryptosporangium aurantiacum]
MRNWTLAAIAVGFGAVGAVLLLAAGSPFVALVILLWFLGWAALSSPLLMPSSVSATEAQDRSAADGRPIIYWRPGCQYCLRLRLSLGRLGRRAHWVNIWSDPSGAAAVRAVADGNETVPTVVVAGEAHVNPAPATVRGWLRR